jgi:hypothetical protein
MEPFSRLPEKLRIPGLTLALLAVACSGICACSTSRPARSPAVLSPSPRSTVGEVASLPRRSALGGGPGYHVIVSAHGTGSRYLGTFKVVKNATLIIQSVCLGPPPLTLLPLFDTGPCGAGQTVTIDKTQAPSSTLILRVRASSRLLWAIYVAQPDRHH